MATTGSATPRREGVGDARPAAGGVGPRPARGRPGFSLVETTVGIVLLEVGVLALAAAAGGVVRMTVLAGREGGSSLVGAARLEELRSTACALPVGSTGVVTGTSTTGLYDEHWSLTADGPARAVQLAVSYADGRRTRTDLYETVIACAP
jgi:Tfp pilus assembly protein PilV